MKLTKRIFSLLLAALVCLTTAVAAHAEEPEQNLESSTVQPTVSEEYPPVNSAAEEEAPAEDLTEEELPAEEIEQTPAVFEAQSLLVTGGHKTYMSGYKGAQFHPDQIMTRAEVAQMLYNLLAAKTPVTESAFSDVKVTDWFGTAVNALNKAGALSGYKDGTFAPNANISRAEFVTALTKCFTLPDGGEAKFDDVSETSWAYGYIAAATSQGWISGVGNNRFEPNRGIKRSEAVAVMNAALGRTGEGFAADRDVQKFKDVPKTHWAFKHITEAAQPIDEGGEDPGPVEPGEEFQVGQTVIVTASSGLNLRTQPTTESVSMGTLTSGTELSVTSVSELPWLGVRTANGRNGYVHSDYVDVYVPGQASGARLSSSSVSLHQYQSLRLDASISSGSLSAMQWTSSDPSVAVVGYSVPYGSSGTQGGIVYGKKPGTTTLTFSDKSGKTKASCNVTVTAPEGVRYGYSSINSVVAGQSFNLTAVAESSKSEVTFTVTGPATGTYKTTSYTEEQRSSSYGLPENRVRVFTRNVTFNLPGNYTVKAQANGSSDACTFNVFVAAGASTQAILGEHRTSNEMLRCIARFEGRRSEVEDDDSAPGNPTVGYGYVVPKNSTFYNTLTDAEMWAMLIDTVNNDGYDRAVNRFRSSYDLKINQAQHDALVSFVYNLGTGTLSPGFGFCRVMLNAVAPPNASEANPVSGTLNVEAADMREQPSPSAKKVVTVPNNSTVQVIGTKTFADTKQIWYQITYDGKKGWMPAGYIQTSTTNRDLTYADSTVLANHILQWCTADSVVLPGLVYRRLAECKLFFFADYDAVYHYNEESGKHNDYHFVFPDICKDYDS